MIRHKLRLKYEHNIVNNHIKLFNEIKTIFSTYTHTKKLYKLKKHFPLVHNLSYDEMSKYKPEIRTISCSLLTTNLEDQLSEFINTAERRLNWMLYLSNDIKTLLEHVNIGLNVPIPSNFSHTLIKYNKSDIGKYFNELKYTNFDIVYKIQTENFHLYANISSNSLCNYILICCVNSTKTYHILFYFDKKYIEYPIEVYNNRVDYIRSIFKK